MNNKIDIKIKSNSIETFFKIVFGHNIAVLNVYENNGFIYCQISLDDLERLEKYYKVYIIREYSIKYLLYKINSKKKEIFRLVCAIILFFIFNNLIMEVNITSNNLNLVKRISKSLDEKGIKRLTFKKNFINIQEIKKEILKEYESEIEWLEIENVGMNYVVKLEERKIEEKNNNSEKCNVVAKEDGVVRKVIATKGEVLVKQNQVVKQGDILISGQISSNEEIKSEICANGRIYAEKWYSVEINIPTTYYEKKYTNKKRYNFLFEMDNRDYKILKSRFNNYDIEKKEIISLLGKKLYLVNEYEYVLEYKEYSDEELDKKIDKLVVEKLNLSLSDDESIISKNILKKEINNSKINIELFVIVEKLISESISY